MLVSRCHRENSSIQDNHQFANPGDQPGLPIILQLGR